MLGWRARHLHTCAQEEEAVGAAWSAGVGGGGGGGEDLWASGG